MAKKFESTARFVKPDWRFQSLLAQKFINAIMRQGKKAVAEGVFYRAMAEVENVVKEKPPIDVFKEALENVKPVVEVRSRRVGGIEPDRIGGVYERSIGFAENSVFSRVVDVPCKLLRDNVDLNGAVFRGKLLADQVINRE